VFLGLLLLNGVVEGLDCGREQESLSSLSNHVCRQPRYSSSRCGIEELEQPAKTMGQSYSCGYGRNQQESCREKVAEPT
jgi:hypothetical protein